MLKDLINVFKKIYEEYNILKKASVLLKMNSKK